MENYFVLALGLRFRWLSGLERSEPGLAELGLTAMSALISSSKLSGRRETGLALTSPSAGGPSAPDLAGEPSRDLMSTQDVDGEAGVAVRSVPLLGIVMRSRSAYRAANQ